MKWVFLTLFVLFLSNCAPRLADSEKKGILAPPFPYVALSQMYRTKGASQILLIEELTQLTNSISYHYVPTGTPLDDYGSPTTINMVTNHVRAACGTSGTLAERRANCNYTWNAKTNGHAGEADWYLITHTSTHKEVWQDSRTGLLWPEEVLNETYTWCQASGFTDASDTTCGLANNSARYSLCAELDGSGGTLNPKMSGDVWTATGYSPSKGMMGLKSTPSVRWRLPTKDDYLQAEIDGLRFVVNFYGESFQRWTATVYSKNRARAFHYEPDIGIIRMFDQSPGTNWSLRNIQIRARCVGRSIE